MKSRTYILDHHRAILRRLRDRIPVFHQSNIFFRDVQYGVRAILEEEKLKVSYAEAESISRELLTRLENEGVLGRVDHQTWVVRYPEFKTPVVKAPAPAKPAPTPSPAPAAAGT
jgi:hypothetical protein